MDLKDLKDTNDKVTRLENLLDLVTKDAVELRTMDIKETDPMTLVGKMNCIVAYLRQLGADIKDSDTKAEQALKNATDALAQVVQAVEQANNAVELANTTSESTQKAIDEFRPKVENADRVAQLTEQYLTTLDELIPEMRQAIADAKVYDTRITALETLTTEHTTLIGANTTKNTAQDTRLDALESLTSTHTTQIKNVTDKANVNELKNVEQDGRLTTLEDSDKAQIERQSTLEQNILDETKARTDEIAKVRTEISELMSGESELNEQILAQIENLETTKADNTKVDNAVSQINTQISNINTEQKTQNDRLTTIETTDTEQNQRLSDLEDGQQDLGLSIDSLSNLIADNKEETDGAIAGINSDISVIKAEQTTQNNRLTAIEGKDDMQDEQISELKTKDETQDTAIANAQSTADGAVTKNTEQDTAIAKAQSTADGAVTKNTAQDTTLSMHETMLGETQKQVNDLSNNKADKENIEQWVSAYSIGINHDLCYANEDGRFSGSLITVNPNNLTSTAYFTNLVISGEIHAVMEDGDSQKIYKLQNNKTTLFADEGYFTNIDNSLYNMNTLIGQKLQIGNYSSVGGMGHGTGYVDLSSSSGTLRIAYGFCNNNQRADYGFTYNNVLFAISAPAVSGDTQTQRSSIKNVTNSYLEFYGSTNDGVRWLVLGLV